MKRWIKFAALLSMAVMTGCSAVNFGVDGLITSPKLTREQSEIHQALVASVGNNITLKYPKSGENRSAFVIKNIDDEPGEEALVFYEYTGAEKKDGLMVSVLDKNEDDKWTSVKEISGTGSEVSTVIISDMGSDKETEVIVGYTNFSGEEKTLEVYNYDNGDLKTIGTDNYSLLESYDINGDGTDELIIVNKKIGANKKDNSDDSYSASLLEVRDGKLFKTQSVEMCKNTTSYVNSVTGKVQGEIPAIYIDELTDKNQLQTEIIYYRYDSLQNPIYSEKETLIPICTRPVGYYSQDVDSDGIVEIPSVKTMLGYETAVEEEKLYLTSWYVYEDFYELNLKYSGYYSISDGYSMMFPNRWDGQVTVKYDNKSEETVFYKYAGDINGEMAELMRIAVVGDNYKTNYMYNGYQLVDAKGRINYMVKISDDKNEPLVPTIDEIKNCFYIVG